MVSVVMRVSVPLEPRLMAKAELDGESVRPALEATVTCMVAVRVTPLPAAVTVKL